MFYCTSSDDLGGWPACGLIFSPAAEFFWLNWPRSPGWIWQQWSVSAWQRQVQPTICCSAVLLCFQRQTFYITIKVGASNLLNIKLYLFIQPYIILLYLIVSCFCVRLYKNELRIAVTVFVSSPRPSPPLWGGGILLYVADF